ncbi:MAG TPA: adenine deaminase [Desulfobacterales bacterium]|nr:adenine deaminase [Desulfobacterales bacterium]HIP39567.1 adenine deaminase [Desulfocapsa sulfexigens]
MQIKSKLQKRNLQARGLEPSDCVLKNCRLIDVFCGEIKSTDIAICDDTIIGIGEYSGTDEIDCHGAYVAPGFIEGHIHIESSMLNPKQFASTVLRHGTTCVVCDPHEIANVAGLAGIRYLVEESNDLQCAIYIMAPSCVPATHLENGGAVLNSIDLEKMLQMPQVIGIAEMMNFPGVLLQDDEVMRKLALGQKMNVPVDGHAPGLSGKDLQAYIGSGIMSDHECTTPDEAREKLSSGMYLFIREGSAAKNLEDLLPAVTKKNSHRCLLVTDDCHPEKLLKEGHLDRILRKAVKLGLDPVTAIQMVTVNVANYFGLTGRGAIAPGYRADLVLFDDLQNIQPENVFSGGEQIQTGPCLETVSGNVLRKKYPEVFDSVHVDLKNLSFQIPAEGKTVRIIRVKKDQLVTESVELPARIAGGFAIADEERDLAKLAVIERHHATGNIGLGFVQGMGLKRGALASTVGHDSHNITVVGMNDDDMDLVVRTIIEQKGGFAVVSDGVVKASLVLDVAGLMSTKDAKTVSDDFFSLLEAAAALGVQIQDPFILMSFLALPVIPHLKMTDLGLVDVDEFRHTSLWI